LNYTTWAKPVSSKHRLPHDEHPKMIRAILLQYLLDCGSPPQANWSGWREEQQHTLPIGSTIKLPCKLVEIAFVEGCQLASCWPPEIPTDQQHGDKCGERQHVLNLLISHVSPSKKTCDHLREKNDQKDDGSRYPQHGGTQRAVLPALLAPTI